MPCCIIIIFNEHVGTCGLIASSAIFGAYTATQCLKTAVIIMFTVMSFLSVSSDYHTVIEIPVNDI